MGLDGKVSLFLSQFNQIPLLKNLGSFLNDLGKGDVLAFLCILLIIYGFLFQKPRPIRTGSAGILVLALSGIIVQSLKHIFGRARPQLNLGDLHFIGPNLVKNGFDSFPSGHAMSSFALAAFFSCFYPKAGTALYVTAAGISVIGRVLSRHHFLSDVVVGGLLGTWLGIWGAKKFKNWILSDEDQKPLQENHGSSYQEQSGFLKKNTFRDLVIITLFSVPILFSGLGESALWDRDETEYAQSVTEMRANDEWLIPTLEGDPFIEKPILLFWFVRLSYAAFGTNEFSSRFPSVVFGVLTCFAVYFLGTILFGNTSGLLASLILSASFLFVGGFRLLLTDPFFVFFIVCSLTFYIHAWKKNKNIHGFSNGRRASPVLFTALSYASIGMAVLAKGPIALFPIGVFLIFEYLTEKKPPKIVFLRSLRHAFYLPIVFAIAAPWFLYSFSVESKATSTFFLYDNLSRFLKGAEGHTGPMFYYVVILFLGFFPWSFFMIPFVKEEWRKRIRSSQTFSPETLFLLLWFFVLFVFFSISATKLPHYMLPALPPLACLAGKFWSDWIQNSGTRMKISFVTTVIFSTILTMTPLTFYFLRPQYASLKLILPFFLLTAAIGTAFWLSNKGERRKSFAAVCAGSWILFILFSQISLRWIDRHRVMKPIALALKKNLTDDSKVYGYFVSEPSLFFYSGRLFPFIEHGSVDTLLQEKGPVFVILKESRLKAMPARLPYKIVERREGFAENGGETTLLLLSNQTHPLDQ